MHERGKYRLHEIIRTASMGPRPNLAYEYKGYTPEWGWRMERGKLEALDEEGRLVWSNTGRPYRKTYLSQGRLPTNKLWTDIGNRYQDKTRERLGYPTANCMKPYLSASSTQVQQRGRCRPRPDSAGVRTAVAAAERLNRRWIGIDITHLAITLIRHRMLLRLIWRQSQTSDLGEVVGEPKDLLSMQTSRSRVHDRYSERKLRVGARTCGRPLNPLMLRASLWYLGWICGGGH